MKRFLLAPVVALSMFGAVRSDAIIATAIDTNLENQVPVAYEELTITNGAAVTLNSTKRTNCKAILMVFENGPVRYVFTNSLTAVSTSVGMLAYSGATIQITPNEAQDFATIATTGTNGILHVTYYR